MQRCSVFWALQLLVLLHFTIHAGCGPGQSRVLDFTALVVSARIKVSLAAHDEQQERDSLIRELQGFLRETLVMLSLLPCRPLCDLRCLHYL